MENKPETIDEYISQYPVEIREILEQVRTAIKEAAPMATETISYRMPTFKLKGNLVHFAAHQKHIGFYPTPSAINEFSEDLKPYKTSKGAIQFPLDESMPFDLIRRMVEFRVKEVLR